MDARRSTSPTVAVDRAGRVAEDVRCHSCGYNLRGISPDGRCPECRADVGRSIHGGLLRYCDPQWVRRLAGGVSWILASILLGIPIWLSWRINAWEFTITPRLIATLNLLVIGVGLVGCWMVTTPDPGGAAAERRLSGRRLTRYMMIAWALSHVLQFFPSLDTIVIGIPWTRMTVLQVIPGVAAYVSLCIHGRGLALRLPDQWLARQTRIVMWGIASTAVPGMLLIFVPGQLGTIVWMYVLAPLMGLYGIWAFLLLFRYRQAFRLVPTAPLLQSSHGGRDSGLPP